MQTFTFDSPVGSWRLMLQNASPDLADAVEQLWAVDGNTTFFREKVMPRSSVELMINLGEPHRLLNREGGAEGTSYRHAWVSGLQSTWLHIESASPPALFAARIRPEYTKAVLGVEASELAERVVDLDLVLGAEVRRLRERMLAARDITERFDLLEQFLRRRRAGRRANDYVLWGARALRDSFNAPPIARLSANIGISQKHLIHSFRAHAGVTPKQFARLVRFERILRGLDGFPCVDWTRLALETGFYDQSHFNREFRSFSGTTPSNYLLTRDPSNQATLDLDDQPG